MNQSASTEPATSGSNRHQIRKLNDALRRTGRGGRIVMTAGVASLGDQLIGQVLLAVAAFDAFDTDNDPYGEHDFGAVQVQGHTVFFKISGIGPSSGPRIHTHGQPRACGPGRTRRGTEGGSATASKLKETTSS